MFVCTYNEERLANFDIVLEAEVEVNVVEVFVEIVPEELVINFSDN